VRKMSVWQRALGPARPVVETLVFDEDAEAIVVSVRPPKRSRQRRGRCGRRAPWYDRSEGLRRWRALDVGEMRCYAEAEMRCYAEAEMPRVACAEHGTARP